MTENRKPSKSGGAPPGAELGLALIAFAILIGSLTLADYLEAKGWLSADSAFIVKEFATYVARLSLVLMMVWIYRNVGFARAVGRDFRGRFQRGWDEMSDVEATKWMIILSLGLFLGASLLMLG